MVVEEEVIVEKEMAEQDWAASDWQLETERRWLKVQVAVAGGGAEGGRCAGCGKSCGGSAVGKVKGTGKVGTGTCGGGSAKCAAGGGMVGCGGHIIGTEWHGVGWGGKGCGVASSWVAVVVHKGTAKESARMHAAEEYHRCRQQQCDGSGSAMDRRRAKRTMHAHVNPNELNK